MASSAGLRKRTPVVRFGHSSVSSDASRDQPSVSRDASSEFQKQPSVPHDAPSVSSDQPSDFGETKRILKYLHLINLTREKADFPPEKFARTLNSLKVNIDEPLDSFQNTALMQEVTKSFENVQVLIKAGADVNARNKLGITPLMKVAGHANAPFHFEIMRELIEAGADVNTVSKGHWTALMYAAANTANTSSIEAVKFLIQNGADVHYITPNGGNTILHYLVYNTLNSNTNTETLKLLLDAGADVNVRNNRGKTVVYKAFENNIPSNFIKVLMEAGGVYK